MSGYARAKKGQMSVQKALIKTQNCLWMKLLFFRATICTVLAAKQKSTNTEYYNHVPHCFAKSRGEEGTAVSGEVLEGFKAIQKGAQGAQPRRAMHTGKSHGYRIIMMKMNSSNAKSRWSFFGCRQPTDSPKNMLHGIKLVTNPTSDNNGSKFFGRSNKTFHEHH
mgnify:CR=1 FL=1